MTKKLKKLLSVLLCVVLITLSAVPVFAADEETPALPFENSIFFEDGDYSIHYRVIPSAGEFKGRVLFIHGFLYSGSTWDGMAEALSAEGYECVLADLPDFGYSSRETAQTEYISREQLMTDLMTSIAPLSEWIVAGHSMGGGIAANIASANPELKALMLYAPAVQSGSNEFMAKLASSDKLVSFSEKLANGILGIDIVVKLAVGYVSRDWSYGFKYDAKKLSAPLKQPGTMRGMLIQASRGEATDFEALADIQMPVLLTWASDDIVLRSSDVSSFSTVLDGKAQTHYVDGGHIFIESQSQKAADITLGFLSELAA